MNNIQSKSGFTLIELLVVIAIIGILSGIVIAALNSARGKANDARRLSDIRQIRAAVNSYANDNGSYPIGFGCIGAASGTKCWTGYSYLSFTGIEANPILDANLSPYISVTSLADPKPTRAVGDRYVYTNNSIDLHCSGNNKTAPYVIFIPESGAATEAGCTALSATYSCCSFITCSHAFCAVSLE